MSSSFNAGSIHIIESLPEGDLRTGRRLNDSVRPLASESSLGLTVHYWPEVTRSDLLRRLGAIADDVVERRRSPILHIEAHGGPDGIELASGETVRWSELKEPLAQINFRCRLNLLVLVSTCSGADLMRIIRPTERAPVFAMIGPTRPITAHDVDVANYAFYTELLTTREVAAAVKRMNSAVLGADSPFVAMTATMMFTECFREYLRTLCVGPELERRVQWIADEVRKHGPVERAEENARVFLADLAGQLELTKSTFFFFDVYPELADRFRVSLNDVS